MIRTKIIEVLPGQGNSVNEKEIGYCLLPEVPIDKRVPVPGQPTSPPLAVMINGARYFVLGVTYDMASTTQLNLLSEDEHGAIMVMVVQRIPEVVAPQIIRAGPGVTMDNIAKLVTPPGGRTN